MPHYMYVAVSGDDRISVFTVDPDNGGLAHQHDVSVPGGPFTLAISPDRHNLYCGTRETPGLTSFRVDQSGGGLTQTGSVPLDSWPVYVNTDRRGRFAAVVLLPGRDGWRSIPSAMTVRWETRPSCPWKRPPAHTPCRLTRPTGTPSFPTSRATAPTRSGSSCSTKTRARSLPTTRP